MKNMSKTSNSNECILDYSIPKPAISPNFYCTAHESWFCKPISLDSEHKYAEITPNFEQKKDKNQVKIGIPAQQAASSPITSDKDRLFINGKEMDIAFLRSNPTKPVEFDRIKNDDGWIDFDEQKPEIGQQIEAQGSNYAATIPHKPVTGIYIGANSNSTGKIKNLEHRYICFFDKWRPADKLTINSCNVDNKSEISCQSKCTCIDKVVEGLNYVQLNRLLIHDESLRGSDFKLLRDKLKELKGK